MSNKDITQQELETIQEQADDLLAICRNSFDVLGNDDRLPIAELKDLGFRLGQFAWEHPYAEERDIALCALGQISDLILRCENIVLRAIGSPKNPNTIAGTIARIKTRDIVESGGPSS